jgi:hypothetical protein
MSKDSKSERISKALSEMKQAVRADVIKRQVLHFRIDESNIAQIYEVAARKKEPVGSMIRQWVIERLQQEQSPTPEPGANKLLNIEKRLANIEKSLVQQMPKSMPK